MSAALVPVDSARFLAHAVDLIAQAKDIDSAKDIRDQAMAMKTYVKERDYGARGKADLTEVIERAEFRMADLHAKMPRAKGTRGTLRGSREVPKGSGSAVLAPPDSVAPPLRELLGVDTDDKAKKLSQRLKIKAAMPDDERNAHILRARRQSHRRYHRRLDDWGKGLCDSPIFKGLCGEHAFCVYMRRFGFSICPDLSLNNGDGGIDMVLGPLTVQVKTRGERVQSNLIRRVDERRRLRALGSVVHVFCRINGDSSVDLLGWILSSVASDVGRVARAIRGKHFNLVIEDSQLEPMSRLVTEVRAA